MADSFQIPNGYSLYFGLGAAAPTTPADQTSDDYNAIGELSADVTINRTRGVLRVVTSETFPRGKLHADTIAESGTFPVLVDLDENAGVTDMYTAFNSTTQGVGAAGTHGYYNFTNGVSGDPQFYGVCVVTALPESYPVAGGGVVTMNIGLEFETLTRGSHA